MALEDRAIRQQGSARVGTDSLGHCECTKNNDGSLAYESTLTLWR